MAYAAIELLPDRAGQEAVRRDWQQLRDAGLPSQLDHTGATNAPHLTLVAAPSVDEPAAECARLFERMLPVRVRVSGLLVLGGARVTVARAVDVPDALLGAVLELRRRTPGLPHVGWLPHVTLARRLDRSLVQCAVDALGHDDVLLSLGELRYWDPSSGTAHTLVQAPAEASRPVEHRG